MTRRKVPRRRETICLTDVQRKYPRFVIQRGFVLSSFKNTVSFTTRKMLYNEISRVLVVLSINRNVVSLGSLPLRLHCTVIFCLTIQRVRGQAANDSVRFYQRRITTKSAKRAAG